MSDIHSCSYYCNKPACIKEQRDELRAKYVELSDKHDALVRQITDARNLASDPTPLINKAFQNRLADAIAKLPFGDTAASFAQFVREFK